MLAKIIQRLKRASGAELKRGDRSLESGSIYSQRQNQRGFDGATQKLASFALGFSLLWLSPNFSRAQDLAAIKLHVTDGYQIADFAVAENGSVWLLEVGSLAEKKLPEVLIEVEPSGKQNEYKEGITAPSGSGAHMIAIGPDKSVWFLEMGKIGRLTPEGKIKEFSVTSSDDMRIASIAIGPDGNLWFARSGSIGKITIDGVVNEYRVGILQPSFLWDIAAGADGNVWFADKMGRVGRSTPDGVVTEFDVNVKKHVPVTSMAAGVDGNIWFLAGLGAGIGRITSQGTVIPYVASPRGQSLIRDLAVGPNGNIWYVVPGKNVLGRVQLDGETNEYAIKSRYILGVDGTKENVKSNGFHVSKIAFSPKGELWFLDRKNGTVGVIVPPYKEEAMPARFD